MLNGLVLEHPSRHADTHRVNDPALIPARGNNHDPHLGIVRQCVVREFDAVDAVEVDVEQHDVDVLFTEGRAGLLDRCRGGCGQPGLDVEPAGQRLGERDIVVHDEELPDRRPRRSQRGHGGRVAHHRGLHPLAADCFTGGPSEYWPEIPSRQERATMLVASNRECAPSLTRTL